MSTVTKQLPRSSNKKHSSTLLVVLALVAAIIFAFVFLQDPGLLGLHAQTYTNPPDLATAMNGGQPTVFGKPSLSAKQIDAILAKWHSPAAGTGQALYDDSVKSGVNDAFAMSVFNAMSKYGTLGIATECKSLGDFKDSTGYLSYPSWPAAYDDFFKRAKAAGADNVQTTLDHMYIPGLLNALDLKKARANEPDASLVLSTMRQLEK